MDKTALYRDMMERTNGDVYFGVVGPVRTGKSTFIKRFAEMFMIPNIKDETAKAQLIDELPQSGNGKSIMTTQPKFVPNEAVEVQLDETMSAKIRLIDCVGFMVPGAIGTEEEGEARMVTTPWFDHDIPFEQAAEFGTKKVIEEHSTVGIVVLTDGTFTDLQRERYADAEAKCIASVQSTGKPYVILINSSDPNGDAAQKATEEIANTYGVHPMTVDLLHMSERTIIQLMNEILNAFPMKKLEINAPSYFLALQSEHPLIKSVTEILNNCLKDVHCIRDVQIVSDALSEMEEFSSVSVQKRSLGNGTARISIQPKEGVFYAILSEACGTTIQNDYELMSAVTDFVQAKQAYDHLSNALDQAERIGYGIVDPDSEQIEIEKPEIVRMGTKYGVRMRTKANSLHLIRIDLESEIQPMIGTEQQCEDFIKYLDQSKTNGEDYLDTTIFGKSIHDLIVENLQSKNGIVNEPVQLKLQSAIQKIANDGCNGMICIML